eukprot:716078-Alexandrium_andersonii.AAC.1
MFPLGAVDNASRHPRRTCILPPRWTVVDRSGHPAEAEARESLRVAAPGPRIPTRRFESQPGAVDAG